MPGFFTVSDNTIYTRGFPSISSLPEGFGVTYHCRTEDRTLCAATGKMVAHLDPDRGCRWPDVLACGIFPFFVVSGRVTAAWEREGVGALPLDEIEIAGPLPRRLTGTTPPRYFWIDGASLRGASIDFEASGFVAVRFCPECGTRSDDIGGTFRRQYAPGARFSYVFREQSWTGLSLFTTDISETVFFCTDRLVDVARKYRLTNFRFIPVEQGHALGSPGLKYL